MNGFRKEHVTKECIAMQYLVEVALDLLRIAIEIILQSLDWQQCVDMNAREANISEMWLQRFSDLISIAASFSKLYAGPQALPPNMAAASFEVSP